MPRSAFSSNFKDARVLAALVIVTVIPIGLLARSMKSGSDPNSLFGFFGTYAGDTLWLVMFFFMGRFLFPKIKRRWLAIFVLALTMSLEFGQLWKPPTLQWLRQQPGIGFVLGNTFVWSDVVCLVVGTAIAIIADYALIMWCRPTGRPVEPTT